jgi:hypothetical protein
MEERFVKEAPETRPRSGVKVRSLAELSRKIDEVNDGLFKDRCLAQESDILDGAAIAAQLRVIRGDQQLTDAINNGDYQVVDALLGGRDGGGVMQGVGERIANKIVTSPELIGVLGGICQFRMAII